MKLLVVRAALCPAGSFLCFVSAAIVMPGVLATFRAMTSPAIHIITHDSFAATVGKPGYCILDCSATWCPPCQRFAPVFAAAAERRRDLTWGTIDTEQEPQLAAALDIRAQPTIVVLR
ncbi:MAG TPA: thioredoxin family protein, partial [Kofleriaceae bacterium]|nr:thioredoxin family protein [Kofleriaceae bacterium]